MSRTAVVERRTRETNISLQIDLDKKGESMINTGIPFFDHMLDLTAAHGFMELIITAKGDTEIDFHHTIEDLGICFGDAIKKALGKKEGIRRYGCAFVPMDEALARVVLDISNRPFLSYSVITKENKTGDFDIRLMNEFFRALVNASGITLHIDLLTGDDAHHIAESIFKAFGRALDQAVEVESRLKGAIPSTKGIL